MHPHTPQPHCPLSTNAVHYVDNNQHFIYPGIPRPLFLLVLVLTLLSSMNDNDTLPHTQTNNRFMTWQLIMQVLPDRMHHHTRQSHCPLSTNSLHYVDHGEHCKYAGIPTLTPLSVGVLPLLPTLEDNNALPLLQTNNTFITSQLTMQVLLGIIYPHTP